MQAPIQKTRTFRRVCVSSSSFSVSSFSYSSSAICLPFEPKSFNAVLSSSFVILIFPLFHGVKVKPVLSRLGAQFFVVPDFPTKADTNTLMNAKDFVVLTVVPLPRDQLAFAVRKPLAKTANSRVITDVGVSFVHDVVGIRIDTNATNSHVEAIGGVTPQPANPSPVRLPLARPRVPFPAMTITIEGIERRLKPPKPLG